MKTFSKMSQTDQEKSTSPDSKKVPKWLQGPVSSGRGEMDIDYLEGEGTALDTAPGRPPYRWKTAKRVKRRLAEMEELHEWIRKKADKDETQPNAFLDKLEKVLNDMVN